MSKEDTIMEDIQESEAEGLLEVYVRMNGDNEKDYCFIINVNDTFSSLHKIFDLPLSLRPSVFYNFKPVGFGLSVHPGYLSDEGCLLYDNECDYAKYIKTVGQLEKISDNAWPGQLVVPIWERNDLTFYGTILTLLTWLYTDLPDAISPTPGLCLTNQVTRFLAYLCVAVLDKPTFADSLMKDLYVPVAIPAQIIFFIFHIVKIAVIFLLFYTGIFNPYYVNIPGFRPERTLANITREELLSIGWTGSKRATIDEYREYYKDYKIKQAGGVVKASRAGVITKLTKAGVILGKGEGWDTPINTKIGLKEMQKSKKFLLNFEYLALIGDRFEKAVAISSDVNKSIKEFRRYGLLDANDVITELVNKRKALGEGTIVEEDEEDEKK